MSIFDLIEAARHNRKLYKSGKADRDTVVVTTIGYRPDPIHEEDGFTPDPGNLERGSAEEDSTSKHNTPSGNREYHRTIRKKGR